ncbi:MAG: hypothetical protein C4K48_10060 [Candidatus Thorarchaeota archaeon]|nr:MAG: hypothetical protein C4K48_10060 [Candidatus Thorarchaeota archaeon]
MQENGFLSAYQVFFIVLVVLVIVFTILRVMAVKQYRLTRTGDAEESTLASLGDMLSNTHMSLFDVTYLVIFILTQSLGLSYLHLLMGSGNLSLPLLVIAVLLLLVFVVFLGFTVRGRAYRRTEMILKDHQTLGHEDWIIRKHVAELVYEREGDDHSRAEVARTTLENLKRKENRTGDAVRQIMLNPEQLKDIGRMKTPPSRWKSYRGSLLVLVVFAVILLYFVSGFISGLMSQYDLFMNGLPIVLLLMLVQTICLGLETRKAERERRKVLFGL